MYPTGISPGRSAFNTVKFINRAKNIDCRDIFLPLPRFAFLSPDDDEILSKQNLPRSYPVSTRLDFFQRGNQFAFLLAKRTPPHEFIELRERKCPIAFRISDSSKRGV